MYSEKHQDSENNLAQALIAKEAYETLKYHSKCDLEQLNTLVRICPRFLKALERRAECSLETNQLEQAVSDYSRVLKYHPNNALYLKLAGIYTNLGELDSSLTAVKECLRSDPDHKECKKHFKTIKKLQKELANLDDLINKRKWRDALQVLFETDGGLTSFVEEYKASSLNKVVYLAACKAYSKVSYFNHRFALTRKRLNIVPKCWILKKKI